MNHLGGSMADIELSPAQAKALEMLLRGLNAGHIVVLHGRPGTGRSTVLRQAHARLGGAVITMKELVDTLAAGHPVAIEEAFQKLVLERLEQNDLVFVDDLYLLISVVSGMCFAYPRSRLIELPLQTLARRAAEAGKRLVLVTDGALHSHIRPQCFYGGIEEFTADDYRWLCEAFAGGSRTMALDFRKIHRFAPRLNAHQLKLACAWLGRETEDSITTDRFIDYLRSQRMASNVDLDEVQAVELHDLKGIDDILQALEANIILPLEDDQLAGELNLKPKRGVLLAGPPGTGKTTVGRALAHRLKSKFFLIDGTFIAGTQQFYAQIARVFEEAKNNAPSIIFIDDSDVIFENGQEMGLYRYLLTMLDGLESQSAGRVCVMLTAMDVGALPPALVRSGRIELWLETRLPDERGRIEILRTHAALLPPSMGQLDFETLIPETEGMTGADLKRLVEDAKVLYAFDRSRGRTLNSATEYCIAAAQTVRENKQRYAHAEAQARLRRPMRPPWFDVMASQGFVGMQPGDVAGEMDVE